MVSESSFLKILVVSCHQDFLFWPSF